MAILAPARRPFFDNVPERFGHLSTIGVFLLLQRQPSLSLKQIYETADP
jgi:hypothetical protein